MKKHKWWHYFYGTREVKELIIKIKTLETHNCWEECKKCGEVVGEKYGITTFSFPPIHFG